MMVGRGRREEVGGGGGRRGGDPGWANGAW